MTYRAISNYFLKLNVAFFSHWRLEAHIPLYIAAPNIGGDSGVAPIGPGRALARP